MSVMAAPQPTRRRDQSEGARRARRGGFRRRDARAVFDLHYGPNMTPMVDVVLVILIFFMASTALLGPELLLRTAVAEDRAPQAGLDARAGAGEADNPFALEAPTLTVRLRATADGRLAVTGMGLTDANLSALFGAASTVAADLRAAGAITGDPKTDTAVIIEIDPTPAIPYSAAVAAHDALTRAGFTRVGLR